MPPYHPPRRAVPGGWGGSGGYFCIPACNFSGFQRMGAGFSTLGISRSRINWACGPEQEVSLNKKKKAVNHSCYPDGVIERLARCFYPASRKRLARAVYPVKKESRRRYAAAAGSAGKCHRKPGCAKQSRLCLGQKKSRTFPTGNALPSIHSFFQVGCVLRGRTLFIFNQEDEPA